MAQFKHENGNTKKSYYNIGLTIAADSKERVELEADVKEISEYFARFDRYKQACDNGADFVRGLLIFATDMIRNSFVQELLVELQKQAEQQEQDEQNKQAKKPDSSFLYSYKNKED